MTGIINFDPWKVGNIGRNMSEIYSNMIYLQQSENVNKYEILYKCVIIKKH